jgi:excisionase family DNA binding protein
VNPDDDQAITIGEAARMLGVTPQTISRWCSAGQLEYIRTLGGHRRISLNAVRKILGGDPGADTEV